MSGEPTSAWIERLRAMGANDGGYRGVSVNHLWALEEDLHAPAAARCGAALVLGSNDAGRARLLGREVQTAGPACVAFVAGTARLRRVRSPSLVLAGFGLALAVTVATGATAPRDAEAEEPKPLNHEWREVGTNHWQIKTAAGEAPETTDTAEGNRGTCPAGMVQVKGKMAVTAIGDELQRSVCTKWINKDFPERCAAFDKEKWAALRTKLATKEMSYCIDRFEYPNRKGEYPIVYVSWHESKKLCETAGKRLCDEDEWTFACEGEDALPYPYGFDRDKDACVVDKSWRWFDASAYGKSKDVIIRELDKLWQGVPSGSQPKCKSPFGVYDMIGNVDEYTRSLAPSGSPAALKGGYWGPVRTRCRPTTRAHGPEHAFYQQGFRCCK